MSTTALSLPSPHVSAALGDVSSHLEVDDDDDDDGDSDDIKLASLLVANVVKRSGTHTSCKPRMNFILVLGM
eukprot:869422-Ditylum_brightwellii.AAC.1